MTNSENKEQLPLQMQGETLQFPVTYRLKAVMTTGQSDAENRKQLSHVFETLKIGYLYHGTNRSRKGSYVSFTYEITLNSKETMDQLYVLLKEIENLKFAL
jgi:putative lipoic acid-binding regulatory protein